MVIIDFLILRFCHDVFKYYKQEKRRVVRKGDVRLLVLSSRSALLSSGDAGVAWLRCVGVARCCVPRFPTFLTLWGGEWLFLFLMLVSLDVIKIDGAVGICFQKRRGINAVEL